MSTGIQWTDETWNVIRGCAILSEGCRNCYAMKQAHRFSGKGQPYEGLTELGKHGPRWTGEARFIPEMLGLPLKWRKPKRVFVNSMSDLFHADITNEQIAAVFGVMALAPWHTFQVLTKRPARMREWFEWYSGKNRIVRESALAAVWHAENNGIVRRVPALIRDAWPLPNVWLGVSCEDQQRADERISLLLQTPAAVHWISAEPLLGAVQMDADWMYPRCKACGRHSQRGRCCEYEPDCTGGTRFSVQAQPSLLAWVVCGGESGPGSRPCNVDWVRSIVQQCKAAGVPAFAKQLGAHPYEEFAAAGDDKLQHVGDWQRDGGRFVKQHNLRDKKGGTMTEWPYEELRVREFPVTRAAP